MHQGSDTLHCNSIAFQSPKVLHHRSERGVDKFFLDRWIGRCRGKKLLHFLVVELHLSKIAQRKPFCRKVGKTVLGTNPRQRQSFEWSSKCSAWRQGWDNRYLVQTRSAGTTKGHRVQNSSGTSWVPIIQLEQWQLVDEHGNAGHLVGHTHIHFSQSKNKESFYNIHVIVYENHSLVRDFQSSIEISEQFLQNFVPLDRIGIIPIFHPGLALEIIQMRFLLKPGR
ncbi:hypothetical protein NPIL_498171 [Nephila pilipes]|uniref:Uncharacterized protein n=1 Tax=Nephila pilipes TaxID=299642 RepID=A0A8X6IH09_NEPPI|nr:hypothetical protein NPIL_498171 [Nephila pilipes]